MRFLQNAVLAALKRVQRIAVPFSVLAHASRVSPEVSTSHQSPGSVHRRPKARETVSVSGREPRVWREGGGQSTGGAHVDSLRGFFSLLYDR
jgi:hypothetical protein